MRIFVLIAFSGLVALTFGHAEIASSDKYGIHHTQHEQSVNAARQSMQGRMSQLEGQGGGYSYNQVPSVRYGNAYGASGSEKYVGCPSCVGGSENRVNYMSRQSSSSQRSSSSNQGIGQADYVGTGIVGHSTNSRYTNDEDDDVQTIVAPTFISGGSSRYSSSSNAYEADDMQQRQVPQDLSSVSSSAYRSSAGLSEYDEDDSQRTVQPTNLGSSRTYSQSRGSTASETSRVGSVVPVYVGGGSQTSQRSSSSRTESELSESQKPIPTGQYVSISARPGQSNVVAIPVRVVSTNGISDDHQKYYTRSSDQSSVLESSNLRGQSPTTSVYRVTYTPTINQVSSDRSTSSTSESEHQRTFDGTQQPEKFTVYDTFNPKSTQTRFRADESNSEQGQTRVAPLTVTYPMNGGSSRFQSSGTSTSQHGVTTQSRVAPVFPLNTVESSTSSRTAEERDQRRYTASRPTYITASRTTGSDQEDDRSYVSSRPNYVSSSRNTNSDQQSSQHFGSSGTTYTIPSSSQTRTQTQQQSGSGSQTQYQRQGGYGGTFTPYGPGRTQTSQFGASSTDNLQQRFGTGVYGESTDDLRSYMSESERLARLQQSQLRGGSASNVAISNSEANRRTLQTASNLDSAAANYIGTSNLASRNSELDTASVDGAGTGGYNRVMSWNKQSKWSSGSEYGTDGKPKSYSSLSTAEAEKHNINGAETGYKAATTTLENDGKVSTYSIHTP